MTPKDVARAKRKVEAFFGGPKEEKKELNQLNGDELTSYAYANLNVYEDTKLRLATLWYVARLIHKQGNLIIGLGVLSLGAALCSVVQPTLNKDVICCFSILGTLATLAGFFHKKDAVIAEKAASRVLENMEKKENSEMTQREVRAASKLSLSFTNLVLTAFQPLDAQRDDPRLLGNRGYKCWQEKFLKRQHVKV